MLSQVVYRTDDTNTLYIMASNEAQQNEWIIAIRAGKLILFLSHFQLESTQRSIVLQVLNMVKNSDQNTWISSELTQCWTKS